MSEKKNKPSAGDGTPLKDLAARKAGALDPKDSVRTAGDRMREHDAEVWPVVEDRKLVGMIDERNPDWKLGGQGHDPADCNVGQIMKRDVIFCYEDEDCATARRKMSDHGLQVLPVVDRDRKIVGMFTRAEIDEKSSAAPTAKVPGSAVLPRPAFEA